ncbi:unnamed protein product [Ectocarpus sp. 4 AP-2014]
MGDNGDTTATPVAPAVPARRGYTISRVEAAPTAASNRPLDVAVANGGYDKAPTEKKQAPHGKGGAGRTGRGGDGGSKDGGRGKKKRAGKGGNAVPLSAGRGDTRVNNGPSGGFDRSKANAPKGSAHQQQVSRGEDSGFAGVRTATTTTMRRDGGRRQYYHEHDDRAEAPPVVATATRPVSFNSRRQHQDRPQPDNTRANPSKPGTASHAKPSHVRGRGDYNSGSGGGKGVGGILSRLGSPPRSPRIGNQDRADDNTNPNVHGRPGSPPPSPRNALSRTDDNTNRHDRRGAHRSSAATLSRTSDAAKGEARLGSNDARQPLPHPPAAATVTTTKQGRKEHQKQRGRAASGANSRNGSGGSTSSFSPSSRRGGVVNNAAKSRSGRQRDEGGRGDSNPVGSRKGESGGSRVSGGRPDAGATAVPVHRSGVKSSGSGREGCRIDRDGAQRGRMQKERQQQQDKYARGTCMSMCPESERREREAEGALSSFEATEATAGASVSFRQRVADPNKAVKKYRRSAAGRDMHSPELLRPLSVLQITTQYLVQDVFAVACSSCSSVSSQPRRDRGGNSSSLIAQAYIFVEDRLRAVRQDLTVQGLALEGTTGAAEVLQTMANFYILAGYLMSDEARIRFKQAATDVFDRHLHTRELQGVFSSLAELVFQGARAELPSQILNHHQHHHLGVDEYLCLQAVHALGTAISNGGSSSGGDTQLGDAAGEQGVGRLFTTTVSKLCSGWSFSLLSPTKNRCHGEGEDAGIASTAVTNPVEGRILPAPVSFRTAFPKMATAVRILAVVRDGNWSEFFRLLGNFTPKPNDDALREGKTLLVGGEHASSPFAVRLRCICHGMLLPVRAHALRAMNKAYGKSEKVPLADVARMLRARDEEHAEGICRALSLPIEEMKHGDGSNTSVHQTDAKDQPKAVVFKCVPAVWKSETAHKTGHFCGTNSGNARGSCTLREDGWVGLTRALATSASHKNRGGSADSNKTAATATCTACAGFGCSWCENGIVKAEEGISRLAQEEEEGLWQVALCPTRKTPHGCK